MYFNLKPKLYTLFCRLICQTVSFSEALDSYCLSKLSTKTNGASSGCTVYLDWLKVWKAGVPALPKILQFNLQNSVNGLVGFIFFYLYLYSI